MKEFMEIDGLGKLKINVVLFESYYPVLFTCENEKRELFLCVCCQSNKQGRKWMITKTNPKIIIDMLNNKIMLRKAFLKFPDVQITVLEQDGKITIQRNDEVGWNYDQSRDLPDKDEYMDSEDGEFDEEISYYKSFTQIDYNLSGKEIEYKYTSRQLEREYVVVLDEFDSLNIEYEYVDMGLKQSELFRNILSRYAKLYIEQLKKTNIHYDEIYNPLEMKTFNSKIVTKKYTSSEITADTLDAA